MTSTPPVDRTPVRVPAYRALPRLTRDPLATLAQLGQQHQGALVRLSLGPTRPLLVTHPDQVQHVLRHPDIYLREGLMWRPLQRLVGQGIAAEGPPWQRSRRVLQPLLSARRVNAMLDQMAAAVAEVLDELAAKAATGAPLPLITELTRVTQRVMIRMFFGSRIDPADGDRLGDAIDTAFQSMSWRLLVPFAGDRIPVPGDRAFARAVAEVDALIYPLVAAGRGGEAAEGADSDLASLFANATDADGEPLDDQQVRDDLVAMFVAGTDTVALTVTWLLLLLQTHPDVARRLVAEVDEVVGDGPVTAAHLPQLAYTRMALQEALRLYPITWIIPRTARKPDTIDGVAVRPGTTVVLSPYVTHRLAEYWPEPQQFRPERFADERGRHRFSFIPFSAGVHQCLGNHFSLLEGQLVMAGLLSRFRPRVVGAVSLRPQVRIDLRPRGNPQLVLQPRR